MRISYKKEAMVWVNYEIPLDVILDYNKDEEDLDNLLSVEKACENGLDVEEYFDDNHWNNEMGFDETGETYQEEEYNKESILNLLSNPEIMGDEYLMNQIMDIITQHQKNKNN